MLAGRCVLYRDRSRFLCVDGVFSDTVERSKSEELGEGRGFYYATLVATNHPATLTRRRGPRGCDKHRATFHVEVERGSCCARMRTHLKHDKAALKMGHPDS